MKNSNDIENIFNIYDQKEPIYTQDLSINDYVFIDKTSYLYILDTVSSQSKAFNFTKSLIESRSAPIYIAFYRRPPLYSWDHTALYLAQNGDTLAHGAIWFGEDIAEVISSCAFGIALKALPPEPDLTYQLIRLPFKGNEATVKAFEHANFIINETSRKYIGYGYKTLRVIEATLLRLIGKQGCMQDSTEKDFDYNFPASWIGGVHCTQLVLLFLKRCVADDLIEIECEETRNHFMNFNSHLCLPCDMMALLEEVWGPKLQRITKEC